MPDSPVSPDSISRRTLLKQVGLGTLGLSTLNWQTEAAPAPATPASLAPSPAQPVARLNRFPRMMQEYFVGRVRAVERESEQRRAALRTKADAEAYVRDVRERISRCFGPWPEKTPLNPRVTGRVERDAYTIENVIFESRPGFFVTANLYLPKGRRSPSPAVLGTCGHAENGKAYGAYQSFAQGLARQGYVVLIFDPVCQGERLQYPKDDDWTARQRPTGGHIYSGSQQKLVGESVAAWFVWDGIRALDYLLTRPEVDPRHVGVTGNSGGGMETSWLCGVETRFTMAAPSCFMTTFRRNLENEEPTDEEQCPERALELGLDYADFIAAFAPKPVLLLGKEMDFFDVRGLEEAYARLQQLYRLLGHERNIGLFVGAGVHGFSQDNREAVYGWFNRLTGASKGQAEPALTLEPDEILHCAPGGQVTRIPGNRTVFDLTKEQSAALTAARGTPDLPALRRTLPGLLGLPPREGVPEYRILRHMRNRRYPLDHAIPYAVESEPGVFAIVYRLGHQRLFSRPPQGAKRVLLYVSHRSADDELRHDPLIREVMQAEPDSPVFACDVRGIGESQPNTTHRDFDHIYGSDYLYASYGTMFGYPYAGQRTFDLLRVIDWLRSHGHEQIHLVAKGWGAIPATFAAVLTDDVVQVTLKNALTSYAAIAESRDYAWRLSAFVPGILKSLDLPDCYRALSDKQLQQIEPWGAGDGPGQTTADDDE